ncbi:hypothetical protein Q7A_2674 [Methylophaga nitratireducenticrescens]|uniref:Lipoprotein n=1 Tax=Methylophaga nitratireducenticrescens TaxID=754476 RepID=I1XM43_METNJ|nr:lipocalin family protein [Methylophaga nitratireducenticrescens]AFI85462.1 hypothetical protein Q7A_2674 [Methylophaga nitratireducenticrescens]
MKNISFKSISEWFILLLAISFLYGCGASENDDLVGTWEIDHEAMSELTKQQIAEANNPMEVGLAKMVMAMIDDMQWVASLEDNGSLSLSMEETDYLLNATGTWSVEDDKVTMTYTEQRDQVKSLTGTVRDGRIYLDPENEGQPGIILTRVGPPLVAIVEEQPQIPPLGPLRNECPPTLVSKPRADGAEVDDIVGLRPGLLFADVRALLECRDDIRVIQTAALWSAQENYGIATRQLLRASDGIPCTEQQAKNCDTGGGHFEPLRDITREYIVAFTGLPEQEVARVIWRRSLYSVEDTQAISVLSEALTKKYGQPQLQATGNHSRINHVRSGSTNLVWLTSREGTPLPPPTSEFSNAAMNWETCVNGLKPQFATRQGWSSGCNLTIRAEILPQPENGLLARELNMVVANQRDLYHGDTQFKNAMRIVSEEKLRSESAAPDL